MMRWSAGAVGAAGAPGRATTGAAARVDGRAPEAAPPGTTSRPASSRVSGRDSGLLSSRDAGLAAAPAAGRGVASGRVSPVSGSYSSRGWLGLTTARGTSLPDGLIAGRPGLWVAGAAGAADDAGPPDQGVRGLPLVVVVLAAGFFWLRAGSGRAAGTGLAPGSPGRPEGAS